MYQPKHNCIYLTKYNNCNHLDRRGILFGKLCLLDDEFVQDCRGRIPHPRPSGPPPACPPTPKPPKRQ